MQINNRELASSPYSGKRAIIAGMARSGRAAALLLLSSGGTPLLYDNKALSSIEGIKNTPLEQCEAVFGRDPDELFSKANLMILSPGIPSDAGFLKRAQARGVFVIGELEFAASFATQPLYAITGTNGKTTTVSLLGDMFIKAGKKALVAGNIGYPLSEAVLAAAPNDPIVVEVSSFQLETIQNFCPQIAAILNITPDHLDRHGDMETYRQIKNKIFKNMDARHIAVFNETDPLSKLLKDQHVHTRIACFSADSVLEEGACVVDEVITIYHEGAHPVCKVSELLLIGKHNVENALAAALIAFHAGVPLSAIARSLREFSGVEHRLETVRSLRGVKYINDSKATNPDSTIKAVEAMQASTVLILGGYDKKVSFDSLATIIRDAATIREVVVTGETALLISKALKDAGYLSVLHAIDFRNAVILASNEALEGETVLFSPACASFDNFRDYEERGRVFKAIVHGL